MLFAEFFSMVGHRKVLTVISMMLSILIALEEPAVFKNAGRLNAIAVPVPPAPVPF